MATAQASRINDAIRTARLDAEVFMYMILERDETLTGQPHLRTYTKVTYCIPWGRHTKPTTCKIASIVIETEQAQLKI